MSSVYTWAGTIICIGLLLVDRFVVNLPNLMFMIVAVFGMALVIMGAFEARKKDKEKAETKKR
ncbi:MAG: hypothetical protein J6D18_00310 [Erysipelotrichaceae bacterium]|nr:hypothetical protein [Erysipelotrichaceae bacterium]